MGFVPREPQTVALTEALKERTWALHTKAERSGIINDILRKKADSRGYALLLRNVLPAYRAMENALEQRKSEAIFRGFARPELYRAKNIAADLRVISGPAWERDLALLPAAERYAARIAEAAQGDGGRLAAHAYVRYFGDLSGGQILKAMLGKSLGLAPDALSFYDFPDIADATAFKDEMRNVIDSDVARQCDPEAVIDEGMRAFEHNIEVSAAVQEAMLPAT